LNILITIFSGWLILARRGSFCRSGFGRLLVTVFRLFLGRVRALSSRIALLTAAVVFIVSWLLNGA
jgi:hypothetical protein